MAAAGPPRKARPPPRGTGIGTQCQPRGPACRPEWVAAGDPGGRPPGPVQQPVPPATAGLGRPERAV